MKQSRTLPVLAAPLAAVPLMLFAGAAAAQDVVWKTQGVTKDEIVLGTHTDLSGVAASFGVGTTNGYRMRIDEANAAGGVNGRKIRLVVEDQQYQVPRAVQAANKLINSDKVFAMLGPAGTPMNNAVLPAQLKAGVPNLFPITWARSMSEPLHPLKFGVYATYADQIRGAIKYLAQTRKKKALCVMYQDSDFGREIYQASLAQAKFMNMEVVATSTHRPTDTDYTVAINKLRDAKCDLVAMGTIIRDTIIPYTTARKIGWNDVDFVGTSASYDQAIASAEGGATEGYYTVGFFDVPSEQGASPQARQFIKKYKERYNVEPSVQAALGYTIADITVQALQRAGKDLTTKSLVSSLEQLKGYQDMFGGPVQSLSSEQHVTSRASVLYQVKDRKWSRVGPVPSP